MTRINISTGFRPLLSPGFWVPSQANLLPSAILRNKENDEIHIRYIDSGILRVIYTPAVTVQDGSTSASSAAAARQEASTPPLLKESRAPPGALLLETEIASVLVEYATKTDNDALRLSWCSRGIKNEGHSTAPFLCDSGSRAYCFDPISKAVFHYVEPELWLPKREDDDVTSLEEVALHASLKDEFVYGLGETTGPLLKASRKYTLEPKDSLGYDPQSGDGMYKVSPFYIIYKKSQDLWFGVYYNTLAPCLFDMGSETDACFGSYRSFRANSGPLDYFVILADGTLPSIIEAYARLVTPVSSTQSPQFQQRVKGSSLSWSTSPVLPPLSQFGYLSSSLGLAARQDAQSAIIEFVQTCRRKGFPLDGLHLSSGWCQGLFPMQFTFAESHAFLPRTRNVFAWNKDRYPDPAHLGQTLEGVAPPNNRSLRDTGADSCMGGVTVITNVKPWILDVHPWRNRISDKVFVQAASDFSPPVAPQGGAHSDHRPETSMVWSSGLGDNAPGSYIDFSSFAGAGWWKTHLRNELLDNGLTGVWIDNNEFSGLMDDEARFRGDIALCNEGLYRNEKCRGTVTVGQAGKVVQVMGMAKATYEALLGHRPNVRPVIVTRSGVPGIQAYAHASWSGDNTTSWRTLRHSTAMTLSVGLSFGTGLYGHDIGGFAPSFLSPSPELLVRWVQHGAWHTRFVVHSWKEVDTTLWMYDDVEMEDVPIGKIIRNAVTLRYQLAPTFYSLYVAHYYRRAWPVLKPMPWYHSVDPLTLALEDQFIFGSHVLVAPVVERGSRTKKVYLPVKANDDEQSMLWWCELDTGIWHKPSQDGKGQFVKIDAALSRIPTLVRGGGILVLGGKCANAINNGMGSRIALLFPTPASGKSYAGSSLPSPILESGSYGSFILIEDDGQSNDHTLRGVYTEIELSFKVTYAEHEEVVEVDYELTHAGWPLPYSSIELRLPASDNRKIVVAEGKSVRTQMGDIARVELLLAMD